MTTPYPITELFAWIVDDPTREHAIMGVTTSRGMFMQAVSSKRENMEKIRSIAKRIAEDTGCPIRLQRFVLAETVTEIEP